MNHKFYADKKYTIWERDYFEIDTDTKEEAIEKIKKQFEEEGDEFYIEGETDTISDTLTFMSVEENDGQPTIEIYDYNTHIPKLILTNE